MKNVQVNEVPADVQLIDVRENDEWAAGHAKGAVHIPMSEFTGRANEVDTDREVYVICKAGGRSAQVGQYLEQAKGANVINVDGGTDAWQEAGLPME